MSSDRRRSTRTDVDLRVEVETVGRGPQRVLRAVDVNHHGIFLATSDAVDLHAYLVLRVYLGQTEWVTLRGRVVRILRPDRVAPGEPPGFGVQLDELPLEDAARWETFCRSVARSHTPAPERRRFERVGVRLQVHVHAETVGAMQAFVTQNISASGALFETDAEMPVGARLELAFHHPGTGDVYRLQGEVARNLPGGQSEMAHSVAVRFDAPEFQAFLKLTEHLGR